MSDMLLLLLGETPDRPLRWGVFDGARLDENGRLADASELDWLSEKAADIGRVVALLPGEQVAARRMPSAPKGAAKALAAARFLMEDELGEAAETLHIVVSQGQAGHRAVAAKAAIVDAWLATLKEHHLDPDVLSADYLVLPSTMETSTIVSDDKRVVVAFDGAGFAIESSLFSSLGDGLFPSPPARVDVLGAADIKNSLPGEPGMNWLGELDDARLLALYGASDQEAPPNLLQGRHATRRSLDFDYVPWRRAGAMAAALAIVAVFSVAADSMRAGSEAARWSALSQEIHATAFPDAADADPEAHARQVLSEGGDLQFLKLSSRFADVLEENEAVQLDRIRFNATRGEYVVSIQSTSDSAIEDLRGSLASRGVAATDNGGYRRSGDIWAGELTARLQ